MSLITYAPLPKVKWLFKSLFQPVLSDMDLAKPWSQEGQKAYWFSRSAVSLNFILNFIRELKQQEKVSLLVPDYFCEGVLQIISNNSQVEILRCPESKLIDQLDILKPDLVLAVHYFGISSELKNVAKEASRLNVFLIEDCAHVLKPVMGMGVTGDFVIYSQHKVLAIPDGALCLVSEKKISKKIERTNKNLEEIKKLLDKFGFEIVSASSPFIRPWIFKRVTQIFLPSCLSKKIIKPTAFGLDTNFSLDTKAELQNAGMSKFSKRLLALQSQQDLLIQSAARRLENAEAWIFVLSHVFNFPRDCFSFAEIAPYFLICSFDSADQAKIYYEKLSRVAVPVLTWPDLPEDNIGEEATHRRMTSFYIPVHGAISPKQIRHLFLKPYLKLVKLEKNEFTLKEVGQDIWEDLFSKIKFSNLLQSYAYGEIKKGIEHWKVYRYVIEKNSQPVALVQVLEKNFCFGFCKIRRINRGPLFLSCMDSLAEQKKIIFFLKKSLTSLRCRLFWAPELESSERILIKRQFWRKAQIPWVSGWIDLRQEESDLRKSLRGNWRNQLNKAEKVSLVIREILEKEEADVIMSSYQNMMKERGEDPLDVRQFYDLLKQGIGVLLAVYSNSLCVGAVLIVRHGRAATYLMGWTGEQGKQHCISNLLVWRAILKAKYDWGCEVFDVGGLGHPSIAEFKRGLNLTEYRLVGEFVC